MDHVETFIDLKANETGVERGTKLRTNYLEFVVDIYYSNLGLGFFSEQAVEAVHADFGAFWRKYEVPLEHPNYLKQLLRAVLAYNAKHV